jgi:hypothetical protein
MLVVQGAYPYLAEADRQSTDSALKDIYTRVGAKTQELIKQISPEAAET